MKKRDVKLAGIVQGEEEIQAVNRVLNSEWHVSGPECKALQEELAGKVGSKYCVVVNSGSSANILALQAVKDRHKDRPYVLTSAGGFPATLNPILHLGMKPLFVDYDIYTMQANVNQVIKMIKKEGERINSVILAHTLGSAFLVDDVMKACAEYDIPLIEDACEALGTLYQNRYVGSFGEVGTYSFYSSHQISGLGTGGAIVTDNEEIYEKCKSLRDWGKKNVREGYICTKMDTMVDGIPYDQQYTYDTIGYNMRLPDANCAYAREQLKRLDDFAKHREHNYFLLDRLLKEKGIRQLHYMHLPFSVKPASFGFPLVIRNSSNHHTRDKFVEHLENNGVHVRLFFAGNILRHKAYKNIGNINSFPAADYLMENACFCGCWPGLCDEDMEYIADTIQSFFEQREI